MTEYEEYFSYLKNRSVLGYIYRNFLLYPRLSRYLNGTALDVGCGIGDMLAYRTDTVGVDINPISVKWCVSQGYDARLMKADTLPFSGNKFDSVLLDNVLEHIETPQPILGEILRVLKPGGHFVIGVPGEKGYQRDDDHKVFYDENKLRLTVENIGFKCRKVFYTPIKSSFLERTIPQYCLYASFVK